MKNKKSIFENNVVLTVLGSVILLSLSYLFYINVELLFNVICTSIAGYLAAFFVRRYGIWGKIIAFIIYLPIFLIPESVWKSIDEIEKKQTDT